MAAKVDNDDTLKALALRMGASVRLSNGETFNADGSRGVLKRKPSDRSPTRSPVSWKFTFERNADGTIRTITAEPTPG